MITKQYISLLTLLLFLTACDKKETTQEMLNTKEETTKEVLTTKKETTKSTKNDSQRLTLTDAEGKKYHLEAMENGIKFDGYEGKVVLIDFFATWCPPCRSVLPHMVSLQNKYSDKIQILSILMEEEKENSEAIAFSKEYNLNFPILNCKENFLLSQALGGVRSLPTMVMYDKNGDYFTHYVGAAPQEMIEADIEKALKK